VSGALEAVIGLEVHVQLDTEEKLFCADPVEFGAPPNTHVCPVCLGLPGALPVLDDRAVELAVRAALGLECTVHRESVFARKNYFYPDLPKGYQISQFERPLATGGRLTVDGDGEAFDVRIRRLHLEEDAGKSIHDRIPGSTAVDLNRTGVPLAEIVSEPDLRSPAQARAYLEALKRLMEYLRVSDCNMEEGSLRVDANVSVRPRGRGELGTKTELKNLNSFSGVERGLELEIERQRGVVGAGDPVEHQTMLYDEGVGEVRPMRSKEESHDYRYFPDPDLPVLRVGRERVERIRAGLPERPRERRHRFRDAYGLPAYDAGVLTAGREVADFFEALVDHAPDPKSASNWVMGPVLRTLKEREVGADDFPVSPERLGRLLGLVEDGTISRNTAKDVFERMLDDGRSPAEIVEAEGLAQVSEEGKLEGWVQDALADHPDEVARFRDGEERLLGFFMGEVMKRSRGKADPGEARRILREALEG